MKKRLVTSRIPVAWHAQLLQIAAETDKTVSELVREAMSQCLNKTGPELVTSMVRRLSALECQT